MVDFLQTGGHLLFGPAVDDISLGTQAFGTAGGVHSHVAAAHDGDCLAVADGGLIALVALVSLHQVDSGQVLVGGVDTHVALARDAHEIGQTGAGGDEHCFKAHVVHNLIDGEDFADDHVGHDFDALLLQDVHLVGDDLFGQTELGDTVHQNAASHMGGFEDGDVVTPRGQVAGTGKAGRAGANNGDFVAVGLDFCHFGLAVGHVPVGDKPLQTTDGDRLAFDAPDAFALTLGFLRADAAADSGQAVGGLDDLIGADKIPLSDLGDELRDAHVNRAAGNAGFVFAVEAAFGLFNSHLLGVAQGDFQEVFVADVGVLLRHGSFCQNHIRHCGDLLIRDGRRGLSLLLCRMYCGASAHQSQPHGRQSQGHPRRRT